MVIGTTTSGSSPCSEIERPFGVSHLATVTFRDVSSVTGRSSWTDPFPKVFCPTIVAILYSFSAPDSISAAEAEPLSTNTTNGKLSLNSLGPWLR
jgi:hypothetical protein